MTIANITKNQAYKGWRVEKLNNQGNATHSGGGTLAQALYEAFRYSAPDTLTINGEIVELTKTVELSKTKNGFYSEHIAKLLQ